MTEDRIKELMDKATVRQDPEDRVWVFWKVDYEKFAKLIIQEVGKEAMLAKKPATTRQIQNTYDAVTVSEWLEEYRRGWRAAEKFHGIKRSKK